MNKTEVSLTFNYISGVEFISDIDELFLPNEISQNVKGTIYEEINCKMDKFRINRGNLIFIFLGILLMFVGGFFAIYIFPFNFILLALGIFSFTIYPIYVCKKRNQQRKMIKYMIDLVDCRSFGIIRVEPCYLNCNANYSRRRRRKNILTNLIVRVIESKLIYYTQHRVNNHPVPYNFQNSHYPQNLNDPLIHPHEPNLNNNMNHRPHYPQHFEQPNQNYQPQFNFNKNIPPQYPKNNRYS